MRCCQQAWALVLLLITGTIVGAVDGQHAATQAQEPKTELYHEGAAAAVARGLAYLTQRQRGDGTLASPEYGHNVGVCALVAMAYVAHGSTPMDGPQATQLMSILDYLVRCQESAGLIREPKSVSYGPLYGHAFATLLLAETYGECVQLDLRQPIRRAVQIIVQSQNDEGGWRYRPDGGDADVSSTVCQMMALRAAKDAGFYIPATTVQRCVAYVRSCQNPDGGFRYQRRPRDAAGQRSEFARSAAGVATLLQAGVYDGSEIERGRDYLRRYQPPAPSQPTVRYFYYGHYYAMQAMWAADEESADDWYAAVRDHLLHTQQTDGSWDTDGICSEYTTALALLALQTPRSHLPILQP